MESLLVGGIELPDAAKRTLSLLGLSRFAKREAQVVERRYVIRRNLERTTVALDGPPKVARRLAGIALLLELVGAVCGQGV